MSLIRNLSFVMVIGWLLSGGYKENDSQFVKQLPVKTFNTQYSFVQYDRNTLHMASDSTLITQFFDKWYTVASTGEGNLNIVHIGGSHVQAGSMSNRMRRNLLDNYPNLIADRGMIFPYSAAAKCNNPIDYKVHCPQRMTLTRNVLKQQYPQPLGLCGISVMAKDTDTYIDIILSDRGISYATNQVTVLGVSPEGVVPSISMKGGELTPAYIDSANRRFVFNLASATDSFRILLPCGPGQTFTVTGVYVGNGRPGFTFHSIGVNGASVPDYSKCAYFVPDLRMLRPDMVVFGIGVNDAAGPNFDTVVFRRQYRRLIDSIRVVNPSCAFVFITNNDTYRRVKKGSYAVNRNGELARDVFYRLAEETGGAVWDQFEVMGGLTSMDQWRAASLAQGDRIHFTRAGYELVGDLFCNALFSAANARFDELNAISSSNNNTSSQNSHSKH